VPVEAEVGVTLLEPVDDLAGDVMDETQMSRQPGRTAQRYQQVGDLIR
jgi:hypothetical protein